MPAERISLDQEQAIANIQNCYLERVRERGGGQIASSFQSGGILLDVYRIDGIEELSLLTDLSDRNRVNLVICTAKIAGELEAEGITKFNNLRQRDAQTS